MFLKNEIELRDLSFFIQQSEMGGYEVLWQWVTINDEKDVKFISLLLACKNYKQSNSTHTDPQKSSQLHSVPAAKALAKNPDQSAN